MTNPFDFGRTMLQTWEKSMGEMLEKMTHDEAFIKNMSSALSGSLDLKKQMDGQLEKVLKGLNMPTKAEIDRMLGYLQRIESRLLDLEDRLDQLPGAHREPAPTPEPAAVDTATVSTADRAASRSKSAPPAGKAAKARRTVVAAGKRPTVPPKKSQGKKSTVR